MEKRVQILLSTYNGEKYLSEQLNSLLQQSYSNIHILIRDDGSKDKTISILKNYQIKFPQKIQIILDKNVGVIKSFFKLIEISKNDYDFYFFCDQDDFWEKDKIEKAIEKIEEEKEEKYIGYCSNLKLVDENLTFIKFAYSRILKPNILNSFLENIVTGCTYACNKNLFLKIKEKVKTIDTQKIPMHDHYFYFLTCLYGKLIYDQKSYILYRQHSTNVIGMKENSFFKRVKKVLFNRKKSTRLLFLQEILLKFSLELKEEERKYLQEVLNSYNYFFKRLYVVFKLDFIRQNQNDSFFAKVIYLLKKF